jgi:hypothetical protein
MPATTIAAQIGRMYGEYSAFVGSQFLCVTRGSKPYNAHCIDMSNWLFALVLIGMLILLAFIIAVAVVV